MNQQQSIYANAIEVVAQFEAGEVKPETFDHLAHIKLGWAYCHKYIGPEIGDAFTESLRKFVIAAGAEQKYHHTLSLVLLDIIAERLAEKPNRDWDEYIADNLDLRDDWKRLVNAHYSQECLNSERARLEFVDPDVLARDFDVI